MIEKTISTIDELFNYIYEFSDKNLFFRGENKNNEKTYCLPPILRQKRNKNSSKDEKNVFSISGDNGIDWFTEKLESLSIKTPYRHCKGNTDQYFTTNALLNISPWPWVLWGEDKLQALMKHYAFDFTELERLLCKNNYVSSINSFQSNFLDITSDIIVALHFACSEFCLYQQNVPFETETPENGYLFVFDLSNIENANYIKLVHYPSYAYFYKNGDKINFQPFDRITLQQGAFLTPKMDKKGITNYEEFENELKDIYIIKKIILEKNVKQELYKIFGSETGQNYYFPKILPLLSLKNNDIINSYKNLKGITLLEKNEYS